jgi:outer membrane protein assembly factor BamE
MISIPRHPAAPPASHPMPISRVAAAFAAMSIAGCGSLQSSDNFLGVVTPYRVEVVQGNVITREQAALIKPGMSRAQVRDVFGSPLLADVFHADRWDYVFTIRRQGAEPQLRRIVVLFDGERVKSVEVGTGELPGEYEFVASIDTKKAPRSKPRLALGEEEVRALPVPPKPAAPAAAAEPSGPVRSYPPLEPRP